MRKSFIFAMSAMLLTGSFLSSCGDDDDKPVIGGPDPIVPTDPGKNEVMTQEQQKEYLEEVALEFMNLIPSSDFDQLKEDVNAIAATDFEDFDASEINERTESLFDDMITQIGMRVETATRDMSIQQYGCTYIYKNIYTDYNALIKLSDITGNFAVKNSRWKYTEADNLQIAFPDKDGKQCVAKLETSGNSKSVHVTNIEKYDDYKREEFRDTVRYTDYINNTDYTIDIPEKITLTLTRDGRQVVKCVTDIELNSIQGNEFDFSKSSVNAKTTIDYGNGYTTEIKQMAYKGNDNATMTSVIRKADKDLITFSLSSDINGIPSDSVSSFEGMNDSYNNVNGKNAFIKIDILGKIQLQGKVADISKVNEYMNKTYENEKNETEFKSLIEKANELLDIDLCYDNKNIRQATVKYEPFCDKYSYGDKWYAEPVIKFQDGTSYSGIESFFNEADFRTVINRFEKLMESYESLLQ